jgi:hypothetical protein
VTNLLREVGSLRGLPLERPGRIKTGKTMTIAVFPGEYRIGSSDGTVDVEATTARLRLATEILKEAANRGLPAM